MNTVVDEVLTKKENTNIIDVDKQQLDIQVYNHIDSVKIDPIYKFILLFFTFSILGWIIETLYSYVVLGYFAQRGFLNGPICPIYGFGAIMLILCLDQYKDKPVKQFLFSALLFTIFEYMVSFFLDAVFNQKYWDYTNDLLNINGRVSLFYTFVWGVFALLLSNFIYPFVNKIYSKILKKVNSKVLFFISFGLIALFLVDVVYTSISVLLG